MHRCGAAFFGTLTCVPAREKVDEASLAPFKLFTFVIYYKKERKVGVCDAL